MSDKRSELPRDLRALCGGEVDDADGSSRLLLYPAESYANVHEVRLELEKRISGPDTPPENLEHLRRELEFVKNEEAEMKRRILDHFRPRPGGPNLRTVDFGAKSKVEKAISDVEAGRYDRNKQSRTQKAVLMVMHHFQKHGRAPSHAELKGWGFNDQQATDAGKWLATQAGHEPNEDPLFSPLQRLDPGRPKKK